MKNLLIEFIVHKTITIKLIQDIEFQRIMIIIILFIHNHFKGKKLAKIKLNWTKNKQLKVLIDFDQQILNMNLLVINFKVLKSKIFKTLDKNLIRIIIKNNNQIKIVL